MQLADPADVDGPVKQTVDVTAADPGAGSVSGDLVSSESKTTTAPAAFQINLYDLDGNLTDDGLWLYTWDAENRLVAMETASSAITAQKFEFAYDYLHRRVAAKRYNYSGTWNLQEERRFTYEGWMMIREDNVTTAKVRTYTWGLDLTGSLSRSGGVGALLAIRDTATAKRYLPGYDGNGNIAVMLNASDGTTEAAYEYGPFGERLRAEGAYAQNNPFQFSTKYHDEETDLVYYGRRYYDPRNGRFLGRDPIEEQGGINLYAFVANNSVNTWDYLGMNPPEMGNFYDRLSPEAQSEFIRQMRRDQRAARNLQFINSMKGQMKNQFVEGAAGGSSIGPAYGPSFGDGVSGFFDSLKSSGFLKPTSDSPAAEGEFSAVFNGRGEVTEVINGTHSLADVLAEPNGTTKVEIGPLQVIEEKTSFTSSAPFPGDIFVPERLSDPVTPAVATAQARFDAAVAKHEVTLGVIASRHRRNSVPDVIHELGHFAVEIEAISGIGLALIPFPGNPIAVRGATNAYRTGAQAVGFVGDIVRKTRRNRSIAILRFLEVTSTSDDVARTLVNRDAFVATAPRTVIERVVEKPPITGGG